MPTAPHVPQVRVGRLQPVRDRTTFLRLRREGRRVRRGAITLTWVPGDPAEPPRVAFAVSRKVGGAVARNRVRRRLRALLWELGSGLAAGAYLVGVDVAAAPSDLEGGPRDPLSYRELRSSVGSALEELAGLQTGAGRPQR